MAECISMLYALQIIYLTTRKPEGTGTHSISVCSSLVGYAVRNLRAMQKNGRQANFFFNRQNATAEASTIKQAKPISIKPRNNVCLNV